VVKYSKEKPQFTQSRTRSKKNEPQKNKNRKGEKVVIIEHNKIIAEIVVPGKDDRKEISTIEKKLAQLSKEGEIVLAKRNKSYVKIPETKEKLDCETIYNEVRADRI
jgi:antitoxin (DNA-binding transcriptional repressor) of toxin-antitoxin stability system